MKKYYIKFTLIFALGILLRLFFVAYFPIGTDEGFLALTAKHISELKEFPLFVSGAHYGGTLFCYINAPFFKLFGNSLYIFRLIAIIFYWLPFLIFSSLMSSKFRPMPHTFLVFLLISFSPPLITQFTTTSVGTYGETLVIGSIIFYLLVCLLGADNYQKEKKLFYLIALLSGFGFWLSPGIIYFLFTIWTLLWLKDRKFFLSSRFLIFMFLFCLGALPAIIYNFQYPAATIFRFGGRILHLNKSVLSSHNLAQIIISQILWRISIIPGCLIDSFRLIYIMATGLKIIFLPAALFYFVSLFLALFKRKTQFLNIIRNKIPINRIDGPDIYLIYTFWFVLLYSFVIGDTTNPDRNRYIAPMYIAFPFLLADFLLWVKKYKKVLFIIFTSLLICTNLILNFQALKVQSIESAHSYKRLLNFLSSNKLSYGYSNIDIAYSINFLSQEKIIYSPTLMNYEGRYPEYTKTVNAQTNVGYIFNIKHREEKKLFERMLKERNISFKKEEIYPFIIYYGLSKTIHPSDISYLAGSLK